ncbi:unnamed protein product [Spirodela intermedia]|uniref:Uncharacterized protein n=2 Tax=Spirodela intermedia TaxID=51605 RepID=A0A7I8J2R9_SPIIN|nr:unnamed protein product [Spirodela intermedia]CAA6664349.1 unnamed protein product [Spirodela intermedia]CAA7400932.1 unnamed protein product [Spirodela intermedia]
MDVGVRHASTSASSILKPCVEIEGSGERPRELQAPRRVKKRTLVEVLEQCRAALELLKDSELDEGREAADGLADKDDEDDPSQGSSSSTGDSESDELHQLLKSRVESPNFLEKLGSIHVSLSQNISDESTSWDMVTAKDLWDDKNVDVKNGSDQDDGDDFVLVKQEDIVDGIACFMATYLLSLKETKELTPTQIQEALSKTFSVKKRKGKLRKAWDGGRVIYNVASWGATAIGIYQNPALLRAATVAFWTSCQAISKLF